MLDVGPSALRDRGHVEAVTLGNEAGFSFREPVELAVPLEVLPDMIAAHRSLSGANAWRDGNIQKSVGHCSLPHAYIVEGWRNDIGQPTLDQAASAARMTGKSMSVLATSFRKFVKQFSATTAMISTIWPSVNPASRTVLTSASVTCPRSR